MSEIAEADVKAAEARLDDIREKVHAARKVDSGGTVKIPPATLASYKQAQAEVMEVRQAWRAQEEAAGRRTSIVVTTDGGEG